jgi:hypothetical protein
METNPRGWWKRCMTDGDARTAGIGMTAHPLPIELDQEFHGWPFSLENGYKPYGPRGGMFAKNG